MIPLMKHLKKITIGKNQWFHMDLLKVYNMTNSFQPKLLGTQKLLGASNSCNLRGKGGRGKREEKALAFKRGIKQSFVGFFGKVFDIWSATVLCFHFGAFC